MAHERSDPLAAAIDEAARRLTDAAPTGFMAARVTSRLAEPRATSSRWLAFATAAAMVLVTAVAAVTWLRPHRDAIDAPRVAHVRPPALPPSPLDRAVTDSTRVAPQQTAIATRANRPRRVQPSPEVPMPSAISAAEAAWRARSLPPLSAPVPIAMDDAQPKALVVPLLQLKPLATSPVVLEPLDGGRQ